MLLVRALTEFMVRELVLYSAAQMLVEHDNFRKKKTINHSHM